MFEDRIKRKKIEYILIFIIKELYSIVEFEDGLQMIPTS